MLFQDRQEAGKKLVEMLNKYELQNLIILALPRGGVPIGYEVAQALDAPLDVVVARKLGAPFNPELGVGAIAPEGVKVLDESAVAHLGISDADILAIESKERVELQRRMQAYRNNESMPAIMGKTVILVDDGLATGVTARAGARAVLKKNPNRLIVAMPVCSIHAESAMRSLLRQGDDIVCLNTPFDFSSVGAWYQHFGQVTDQEVIDLLAKRRQKNM